MPNIPRRMARGALTTVSANLYTVPAATNALVTEIVINNTTAQDITPTVRFAGVDFITGSPVPGNGMLTIGLKQVLSTGEIISGFANVAGLNIFISGVEVT